MRFVSVAFSGHVRHVYRVANITDGFTRFCSSCCVLLPCFEVVPLRTDTAASLFIEFEPGHVRAGTLTLNKLTVNQADVFPTSHIPHEEVCALVTLWPVPLS